MKVTQALRINSKQSGTLRVDFDEPFETQAGRKGQLRRVVGAFVEVSRHSVNNGPWSSWNHNLIRVLAVNILKDGRNGALTKDHLYVFDGKTRDLAEIAIKKAMEELPE